MIENMIELDAGLIGNKSDPLYCKEIEEGETLLTKALKLKLFDIV